MNLALNDLQRLICYQTEPNQILLAVWNLIKLNFMSCGHSKINNKSVCNNV